MDEQFPRNRRHVDRFTVSPMYTSFIATPAQWARSVGLHGHVYDISATGVRVELDKPLARGDRVDMEIGLPGAQKPIVATGDVVWVHSNDDDPGPKRMAMQFVGFKSDADEKQLEEYLQRASLRKAA